MAEKNSTPFDDKPASRGLSMLRLYAEGKKRLTRGQAIIAHCCQCMGYYVDGRQDCEMDTCPLYPFYPYREDRKVRTRKNIA